MTMIPTCPTTTAPLPVAPDVGFVGECAADGQRTRVASVALDDDRLILLNLVGYETSINAAFGKLMKAQCIGFLPAADAVAALAPDWELTTLQRHTDLSYWLWRGALRGTKERQGMIVPHNLSLPWGRQHPPRVPATSRPTDTDADTDADTDTDTPAAPPEPEPRFAPRYLVAGLDEPLPPYRRFFGHLRGLRVVLPPTVAWVAYLWEHALASSLLRPLPALGVRVWRMDGDPRRWNALSTEGIRGGVLTATPPTDADTRALGLCR